MDQHGTGAEGMSPCESWKGVRLSGRILVVEDVAELRRLCCIMLEGFHLSSCVAENAEDALEILRAEGETYRVVLTDLAMPGKSGFELIGIIRAEFPSIKTVLMTGAPAAETEEGGSSVRPDAVLGKPFTRQELLAVLDSIAATALP